MNFFYASLITIGTINRKFVARNRDEKWSTHVEKRARTRAILVPTAFCALVFPIKVIT